MTRNGNIVIVAMVATLVLCGFARGSVDYYVAYAEKFVALGQIDRAFAYLQLAVDADPTATSPYLSRAFLYLRQGERDKALADFTRVIELRPAESTGYLSRGMIYSGEGEHDKARADYRRACDLGDSGGCEFLKEELSGR
jgi:Tfp pilus assembly protein PilF